MEEIINEKEVVDPYGFIYITTNMVNGKRYLGQKKFDRKWKSYLGSGIAFKEALNKYGENNFKREIIYICYSEKELNQVEYELSVFLNVVESQDWYNLVYGGGTTSGIQVSEETRKKLSDARKKNIIEHPEYDKYHGEKLKETYQKNQNLSIKISERSKKLWNDPEYKDKVKKSLKKSWEFNTDRIEKQSKIMTEIWKNPDVREVRLSGLKDWVSNPDYHIKRSELSKKNWEKPGFRELQVEKMTGKNNPMYGTHRFGINSPNFIPIYCIELNKIFWGAKLAEQELKIKGSDIAQCCKGKKGHNSAGKHPITGEKLHWLYAENAIEQNYITKENLESYINNIRQMEDENYGKST